MSARLAVLVGVLVLIPVLGADDEAGPRRLLLLGPDGKRLAAVARAEVPRGPDGVPVFDPEAGGETETLVEGVLLAPGPDTGPTVLWGPGLAARRLPDATAAVGLRLARAVPFGGTLRFDRGGAAAGVEVRARRAAAPDLVHRTRTDAQGVWRFAHVGAGTWDVTVRRGDGREQSLGAFTAGQPDTERTLVPGSRVEGQLRDGDAGLPTGVGGLRFVLVRLPAAERLGETPFESAEDGTFVLDDVPAGVYEARLLDEAYVFEPARPRLEVPPSGRVELRPWFVLRGRTVEGRVEGPRETRIQGAQVLLVPDATQEPPPGGWPPTRPVRTDAEGRFVLHDVRPASGYRLAVGAAGHAATLTAPFDVTGPAPTTLPPVLLATGWRLEVRARAPGGVPRPGVGIHVVPADHPITPSEPAWGMLARRAVTNAAGEAVLEDLPDGDVRVLATAPDVTDVEDLVPYPPSGDVRSWTATLYPAPGLEGRIRTAGGAPLPALRVRAVPRGDRPTRAMAVAPGGRFAFEGLGSEPVDLVVVRPGAVEGLAVARLEGLVPGRSPPVEILLPEPGTIEGRVKDARDEGPGVRVLLEAPVFEPDDDLFRWRTVASARVAADDARAAWRFSDLPPGSYAVRAVQGDNDSGTTAVRLDEGATETVDLFLMEAGRVAGIVVDDRAQPRLGAEVRLVRLRGDGDAPGRPGGTPRRATDAAGEFVFEDVAPGVWRVEARDEDGAEDVETIRVAEGESVVVRDLVVGSGGAIEGTVTDGEGRALDGALLVLEPVEEGPDARRARTGRDGVFRVEGLRAGAWRIRLRARAGPFTDLESLVEVVADETSEIELTAPGRARLLGRVWRRGEPVPDLALHLVSRPGGTEGLARRLTARTDGEGRFAFDGLSTGTYVVDIVDGGVWSARPVTLEDGDIVTLDLEVWEGRIPGEVRSLTGAPIANATILARPRGAQRGAVLARVRTDPQGRFLFVGLPVGRYDLRVSAPGLPPGRLDDVTAEVEGAERPVVVTVGRGGTLDLLVLGPDGRGVAGTRVWVEDRDGIALHARPYVTGTGGRLRLEGTVPGRHWIRAWARRHGRPARTAVVVKEGERTNAEVRLPLPGRLTVEVRGTGLEILSGARIVLLHLPGREPVIRVHDVARHRLEPIHGRLPRTGIAVFDELAPGEYLVQVDASPRFEIAEVPYEMGALDDGFLEIDLVPAR